MFQSSCDHLRKEDKTKQSSQQLYFILYRLIGGTSLILFFYFIKLYKQLREIGPRSLFNKF